MTRELTPREQLENQLTLGQCRIGHEAAREIARQITGQHGFWDFDERKRAHEAQHHSIGDGIWTVLGPDRKPRRRVVAPDGESTKQAGVTETTALR